jgi:hypothetical protein
MSTANLPATIQPDFGAISLNFGGIELKTLADLNQFALMCIKAKWVQEQTPAAVVMKIIQGRSLGLPDMTSLQNIAVINGRPCLWGDAMRAVVEASGEVEYIEEHIEGSGDDVTAVCEVKRKGRTKPHVARFSMADARLAGLAGRGTWKNYPRRMLQLRARAFALRDQFADKLCGVMMAEEMQDAQQPAKIVSGDTVPPADLDAAADLLDSDQPAMTEEQVIDAEIADFEASAAKEDAAAVARGDATPLDLPF